MTKKLLIISLVILAVLGSWLLALKFKTHQSAAGGPVRIGVVTWIGNGVFYVAQQKGFFTKENVAVELVQVNDSGVGKQLLISGQIDALYLTPESVINLAAVGTPVVVLAGTDKSSGADGIVARNEIKTIADLKGKKVAFEVGSPSHFLLSYLLSKVGLSTKDLVVVNNTAPDAGAAFVSGAVDAAVTWEPWLTRAGSEPGKHLLASSKDAPVVYDMLIFRKSTVATRPQDIKSLLRALFASRDWIYKNEAAAAALIAPRLDISAQEAAAQMRGVYWLSYKNNLAGFLTGPDSVKNSLLIAAKLWQDEGIISAPVDVNNLVDDSFLKNLYQ